MILLSSLSTASAADLSTYRWKHRLIVISTLPEQAATVAASLKQERAGILDRDLVIIDLSLHRKRIAHTVRPAEESIEPLRKRFSLSAQTAQFVLIGKDGGVKARQAGTLDLQRYFTLIDAMPMRQEEMRRSRD